MLLLWQIGADWRFDPDLETEVEISFSEVSTDHTRLELRHRNLQRNGDQAEQMRAVFDSPRRMDGHFDPLRRAGQLY